MPAKGQPSKEKKYATPADRQKAYRERLAKKSTTVDELLKVLTEAFDAGRCHKVLDDLPEESDAAIREIIKRIKGKRIILTKPEDPLARKARRQKKVAATKGAK